MSLLTVAQIDSIARNGSVRSLTAGQLSDAHHAILFARDPAHLGEEPHLRCEVDACGVDDDRLVEIEGILWAESARRNDATSASPMRLAA